MVFGTVLQERAADERVMVETKIHRRTNKNQYVSFVHVDGDFDGNLRRL